MRWSMLPMVAVAASIATTADAPAADVARKPNVLVILADDQGFGDLSVHGNTNLATPRIDSLARDGARFDRFYVCPVCSPTRAELLTGRYHPRGGVYSTSTGGERLDLDESTLADSLRAAGYATACFGKWHNGSQYPYHPRGRGFGEFYGFTSGHWGHYFDPELEHNGSLVRGKGYIADDLTDHAMAFIADHRDKPFFVYLAYCTPHSPMQAPDRFYAKFDGADLAMRADKPKQEDVPHTRAALAMCESIDFNVGRLLDRLDALKLADDTIVVYLSDNGPNGWRWNDGMAGKKGSTDEGGVRSPLLIRWPKHIAGNTNVTAIAGAIDLMPTLLEFTGVPRIGDKSLDGRSLAPLLVGDRITAWPDDRVIFSHWAGKVSARTQRYRLDAAGRLFDMTADPGQRTDVAADHPNVAKRLTRAVADWRRDVLGELDRTADRPFPVGYAEFPVTLLPARDGEPHGSIRRSSVHPNCSFFTNWTKPTDSIVWPINVHAAGRYDAVVYYTCPAADVGSTVTLALGDSRVSAKVTEPHDPPLYGPDRDRAPRTESPVKDFAPMKLGELRLPAGRGELTLSATDIPGSSVMDVRYVVLTLIAADQ